MPLTVGAHSGRTPTRLYISAIVPQRSGLRLYRYTAYALYFAAVFLHAAQPLDFGETPRTPRVSFLNNTCSSLSAHIRVCLMYRGCLPLRLVTKPSVYYGPGAERRLRWRLVGRGGGAHLGEPRGQPTVRGEFYFLCTSHRSCVGAQVAGRRGASCVRSPGCAVRLLERWSVCVTTSGSQSLHKVGGCMETF